MYRFAIAATLLCIGTAAVSSGHDTAARAAADRARLETALAGLTPGKPQQCLDNHTDYGVERIGDTILYRRGRHLVYRADTNGGCFGLDRGDAIVSQQYGSQLCAGDPIRTIDLIGHIPSGVCTIRSFVPYRAPRSSARGG